VSDLEAGLRYLGLSLIRLVLVVAPVAVITNTKRLRIVLIVLILTFVAVVGFGLVEMVTGFHLPMSKIASSPERHQWMITSVFYNPNDFALYLGLWFAMWLSLLVEARSIWEMGGAGLAILLIFLEIGRTGARSGWLALAMGAIAVAMIWKVRVVLVGRVPFAGVRILLLTMALLIAVFLLIPGGEVQPLLDRTASVAQRVRLQVNYLLTDIEKGSGSGAYRLNLLRNGWRVLEEYYLLGVGPGNAEYHMASFDDTGGRVNLHCWWMEVLVNGGLLGFLLFGAFYLCLLRGALDVALRASDHVMVWAGIGIFASLFGLVGGAFGPSSMILFMPPWIHLGLALAVVSIFWRKQIGHVSGCR
jgi:hypothetical protein